MSAPNDSRPLEVAVDTAAGELVVTIVRQGDPEPEGAPIPTVNTTPTGLAPPSLH